MSPVACKILSAQVWPFRGWAVHPFGVEKVLFRLGSGAEGESLCGLPRPDIAEGEEILSGMPDADRCGFETPPLPMPPERPDDELFIRVIDKEDETTELDPVPFRFRFLPDHMPRMVIDSPRAGEPVDDSCVVLGWYRPLFPESLDLFVDDVCGHRHD